MPHASVICFISFILLFAKVKEFVGICAEEWVMCFDTIKNYSKECGQWVGASCVEGAHGPTSHYGQSHSGIFIEASFEGLAMDWSNDRLGDHCVRCHPTIPPLHRCKYDARLYVSFQRRNSAHVEHIGIISFHFLSLSSRTNFWIY